MTTSARGFVLRHTRVQDVAGLGGLKLHLTSDVLDLWRAVQEATGDRDAALPYWAIAWGGGLAIASYLRDHPQAVSGRRVLDMGSGSGLCAIAAMRAGAATVTAVDVDPFAIAAINLNAKANRVRINVVEEDILDAVPDADVILAGDCWYEQRLASRVTTWAQRAADSGVRVVLGDPGRRYFERDDVRELATYVVRSTSDLEDLGRTRAWVYELETAAAEAPRAAEQHRDPGDEHR